MPVGQLDAEGLSVTCPHCHKRFQVRQEYAGRKGKCTACQTVIQIPQRAGESASGHDLSDLLEEAVVRPPVAPAPSPTEPARPQPQLDIDRCMRALERAYEREADPNKDGDDPAEESFHGKLLIAIAGTLLASYALLALLFGFSSTVLTATILIVFFGGVLVYAKGKMRSRLRQREAETTVRPKQLKPGREEDDESVAPQ